MSDEAPIQKPKPSADRLLSVHHRSRGPDLWCVQWAPGRRVADLASVARNSLAQATADAIEYARAHPAEVDGITGHVDKRAVRAAGLRYVDSRGNRRRSTTGKGRPAR